MKKNNSEAIELAKIYHKWIEYSTIANSQHTVRTYEFSFRLYIEFLEEQKEISTSSFCMAGSFSISTIKEWLAWLSKTRSCKPQSCNARFAATRSFLKYAGGVDMKYRHLYLEACCIPRMKESKRQVEAISKEAMKTLLQMPNPSTIVGLRDVVLFSFLYGTAARIDEILSLKLKNLHLDCDRAYAVIVGKGNKMRTLFIQKLLAKNIEIYIRKFHGDSPNPNSYLFFSRVGGHESKLTQPAVNKRLKLYAKAAHSICQDVPLDMHAHVFRHSCASHWLEDGMNIVQVSKLLGHASIATTMTYLSITMDMKTKAVMLLEDEQTRKITKQWKNMDEKLSALFTKK